MFRAFSDPTRLRLLNLLGPGEVCVCDLARIVDAPQPKVSRHLAYLRRAGLVVARREGFWMHYRLAAAGGPLHRKLMECLACCTQEMPELATDLKQREAECRGADCCR